MDLNLTNIALEENIPTEKHGNDEIAEIIIIFRGVKISSHFKIIKSESQNKITLGKSFLKLIDQESKN